LIFPDLLMAPSLRSGNKALSFYWDVVPLGVALKACNRIISLKNLCGPLRDRERVSLILF
jgi:hypothetical protein